MASFSGVHQLGELAPARAEQEPAGRDPRPHLRRAQQGQGAPAEEEQPQVCDNLYDISKICEMNTLPYMRIEWDHILTSRFLMDGAFYGLDSIEELYLDRNEVRHFYLESSLQHFGDC